MTCSAERSEMKSKRIVAGSIAALSLVAIGQGVYARLAPAAVEEQKVDMSAAQFWMKRARIAEAKAKGLSATLGAYRRNALRRSSSVEAIRLASISSSDNPVEQKRMFDLLYKIAACETTGTYPAPYPATDRVLNPSARNPTGEHATGLMQFLPSTFMSTKYSSVNIWSPYAQALAAVQMIQDGRINEWSCAWASR